MFFAKAGEFVIDVCACPGGKSFAASIIMNGGGRVKSFDLHESKLSLIESGAVRLGLGNLSAKVTDATKPDTDLYESADCVICDVPCSGMGVIGKKPDLRYKREEDVARLPDLQYEILSSSVKYLKDGGKILYSTCTLLTEENEGVIERFLMENPSFRPIEFTVGKEESKDGRFTFYPHIHGTDGFFVCLLQKGKSTYE